MFLPDMEFLGTPRVDDGKEGMEEAHDEDEDAPDEHLNIKVETRKGTSK